MRHILNIMSRELRAYFVSPLAYVILIFFLFIVGMFFVQVVFSYSQISLEVSRNPAWASQVNLHDIVIRNFYSTFSVIMLFVAPLLSMRVLAEEKKLGTAEMLLTAPISTMQLVIGKYLGALGFGVCILIVSLQYPLFLVFMGARPEVGPLAAVYLGTLLLMGAFLAVGVFASSLTSNQLVAAIIAFVINLFFWVVGFLGEIGGGASRFSDLLKNLSVIQHYGDFLKGIIDTGSVAYYLTFIVFGLFLTQRVIDSGRWR